MKSAAATLPVILILENIRSLHNVGAIFRSALAAKIERLVLAGLTPTPPRPEIEKTALGATKNLPWQSEGNLVAYLKELKRQGYQIVALEQTPASQDLYLATVSYPLALIVGHEREGVTSETLSACDLSVELPMRGLGVYSLNVSTATGIALYELGRRFWYDN